MLSRADSHAQFEDDTLGERVRMCQGPLCLSELGIGCDVNCHVITVCPPVCSDSTLNQLTSDFDFFLVRAWVMTIAHRAV